MAAPIKPGWKSYPNGNLLQAETSLEIKTGAWASDIPVWNQATCINCLNCWTYCPDECWSVKDGKNQGVSLEYCKGCGICANECLSKPKSITMVPKNKK